MPQQLNQHPIDFGVVAHGFHYEEAGQTHRADGTVLGNRVGESAANGRNISTAGMDLQKRKSRNKFTPAAAFFQFLRKAIGVVSTPGKVVGHS